MDFNKVIIAGRLTRDPEIKYLSSGNAFCAWGMATNRYYNDNNGERQQEVCFVDVKAFGRQAEIVGEYAKSNARLRLSVTKGNPLFVEGRLSFYQFEDENGQRRNKLSVIAERIQLLPQINSSISAGVAVAEGERSARTDENFPEEPPKETEEVPPAEQETPVEDDVPF